MKQVVSGRHITLISLFIILLSSFLVADSGKDKTPVDTFNHEWYKDLLSQEVNNLDELIQSFDFLQLDFIAVAPPDPVFVWTQDAGLIPFNPKEFPAEFITGLVPDNSDGIAVYPITIAEDPITREKKFYNVYGKVIASVAPRSDYNKNWIALDIRPELYTSGLSKDCIDEVVQFYDPSRVMVRYNLILRDDLAKYVLKQSYEESLQKKSSGGIGIMKAYTGAPVTNIVFTWIEKKTNGMMVTIAYPFNLSTYPTNCYTNKMELFVCTNLLDFYCTSKGITNVSSTTNWIEWLDTESTSIPFRFYCAGNADVDSDGDGLTDAREKYMYHTCSTNSDSDLDGLSDYEECINLHTDPNNSDTNKPVVCMTFPTNNFSWVLLP